MRLWNFPLDSIQYPARMHAGNPKSIKRGGAVVEKQNIRTGVFAMARVDSFVFAIVDPKSVKDDRHARVAGRRAEFIACGAFRAIDGNAGKRPFLRSAGRAVDAIPAINVKSV